MRMIGILEYWVESKLVFVSDISSNHSSIPIIPERVFNTKEET